MLRRSLAVPPRRQSCVGCAQTCFSSLRVLNTELTVYLSRTWDNSDKLQRGGAPAPRSGNTSRGRVYFDRYNAMQVRRQLTHSLTHSVALRMRLMLPINRLISVSVALESLFPPSAFIYYQFEVETASSPYNQEPQFGRSSAPHLHIFTRYLSSIS